jgi:hypothetical protein
MPKIYIAGPMTGYPEFNFPAFNAAQDRLEEDGWFVFNPARKDVEAGLDPDSLATGDAALAIDKGFDFRDAYTWDVTKVIEADAIYMLNGYSASVGALGELAVATAMQKHYPEYQILYEETDNV